MVKPKNKTKNKQKKNRNGKKKQEKREVKVVDQEKCKSAKKLEINDNRQAVLEENIKKEHKKTGDGYLVAKPDRERELNGITKQKETKNKVSPQNIEEEPKIDVKEKEENDANNALPEGLTSFLTCPVCLMPYSSKIFQCLRGHSVCDNCSQIVPNCLQCGTKYIQKRDIIAENVVSLLRLSLNDKTKYIQDYGPRNYKYNLFGGCEQGKGMYKCCVPNCNEKLPICRLLNHCRWKHPNKLIEFTEKKQQCCISFTTPLQSCTKIFQISKFGLFYLNIVINKSESKDEVDVCGLLQIASSSNYAKTVRYSLNLQFPNFRVNLNDIPYTVRESVNIMDQGYMTMVSFSSVKSIRISLKIKPNKGLRKHQPTLHFN